MTNAEYERQKARVLAAAERWRPALGLGWWAVQYQWREHSDDEDVPSVAQSRLFARCWTNWTYAEATIRFFMDAAEDLNDEDLERAVIHEFMHVLLNEMRELKHDAVNWLQHEEHTATLLAKAFWWARAAFAKEAPVAQAKSKNPIAKARIQMGKKTTGAASKRVAKVGAYKAGGD